MNALFNEIVGCRYYLMQKSVFGGYRANVFNFLNTRQTEHQKSEKRLQAVARFVAGQLATDAARLTNFRVYDDEWDEDDDDNWIECCPHCSHQFTQWEHNYNNETRHLDYKCPKCGWTGNENEISYVR